MSTLLGTDISSRSQIADPRSATVVNVDGKPVRPEIDLNAIESVWDYPNEVSWVVDHLIPDGGVTAICAPSGSGKSWFSHALAVAVASGQPFLGLAVSQRPVLILDKENPVAVIKRNLRGLGLEAGQQPFKIWGGWRREPLPKVGDPRLLALARSLKPLIIIDSLIAFYEGDESSSSDMRAFMQHLRDPADAGATVLLLHHTGKADSAQLYRGSSDFEAALDMGYSFRKTSAGQALSRLLLEPFKSRIELVQSRTLEFQYGTGFRLVEQAASALARRDIGEVIDEVLNAQGAMKKTDLVNAMHKRGFSKDRVRHALNGGSWQFATIARNAKVYQPRNAADAQAPRPDFQREAA